MDTISAYLLLLAVNKTTKCLWVQRYGVFRIPTIAKNAYIDAPMLANYTPKDWLANMPNLG